ncbi:MAG: ATP-grasp domain-containing protein, partial [Myxococcota bacterium]
TAQIAAEAAQLLGLAGSAPAAARTAASKQRFRQRAAAAGLRQPRHAVLPTSASAGDIAAAMAAAGVTYPVVLKPLHLSASRGVMRADDPAQLAGRWRRLCAVLGDPEVIARDPDAARYILIETFISGRELAFEGVLERGTLLPLALFDKPDPLDGPFFAETIYVAPSAQPAPVQRAIVAGVAAAAAAMGLDHGPVHAELRLAATAPGHPLAVEPVILEVAARGIGGLCGRIFGLATGIALEELLLAQAAGRDIAALAERVSTGMSGRAAAGVHMLPVPRAGVVRAITGQNRAAALEHIRELAIAVRVGEEVVPLPEGNRYMGFVFATAPRAQDVVAALRRAGQTVAFEIAPLL